MDKYKVLYYKDENGKSEALDFIFKARNEVRAKIYNQIKHLKEFGLTRMNPSVRKLTNTPLWEVRILGKDNIRLFCGVVESSVVIFHIFSKKQQKTPAAEIRISLKRYSELLDI